jgi:ribosomal protein S18 acetylase RimI-like enzyme
MLQIYEGAGGAILGRYRNENSVQVSPPVNEADRTWLQDLWRSEWGGDTMVSKGNTYVIDELTALIAKIGNFRVGAVTYRLCGSDCELLSINSTTDGQGVGTQLLGAFEDRVREEGIRRVWLVTTNDNLNALRFYQRRGYRIIAVYPNAIDFARKIKPTIPAVGFYDIPIRDEIELEKWI